MPHTIGTEVGLTQKEPGTKAGVGGETESIAHPLLFPKQGLTVCDDMMTGIRAAEKPVSLATTAHPFPNY